MATLSWSNSSSLEDGTMNNSSNIFRNYEESEFDEYEPCEGEYDFGSSHNNNVSISREECRSPPIVMRANPICHYNDDECYISDDCDYSSCGGESDENVDSTNYHLASFSTKFDSAPQHSFRRLRTEVPPQFCLEEINTHKISSSSQLTMICYDEMMEDATTITPSQSALTAEFFEIDSKSFFLDDMRDDNDIFDDNCRSYPCQSSRYDETPRITQSSSVSSSSTCSPRSRTLPSASSIISDYGDAE